MTTPTADTAPMDFGDLRGILRYVPQFRGRIIVVAVDGGVLQSPKVANLLLDLAVLNSLNIPTVLVHGAAAQVRELGRRRGVAVSNDDGAGATDQATLEVAIDAVSRVGHQLMCDLTALDLRAATTNALIAHPTGLRDGVDLGFTGRVERVDAAALKALIQERLMPVIPPLGFDGGGRTLRLNSDAVAAEVALALDALKLVYIGEQGLQTAAGDRIAQLTVQQARELARSAPADAATDRAPLPPGLISKLRYGALACQEGVPRVHLLAGDRDEVLLAELFSAQGVGTMIHADAYHHVRKAGAADLPALLAMMQYPVEESALLPRSKADIEARLGDFRVIEVDGHLVGCVALHLHPDGVAELAGLCVRRANKGRGFGRELVRHVEDEARQHGCRRLVALSTQAFRYFEERLGWEPGEINDLPEPRRQAAAANGRNSRVVRRELG